ncbi:hypothetical protein [Marinobacter sp. SS13-12]|uniref:hypothetical protein n=1 Tax=Marinobacter sp. SS13-12 TaxID=3050451 RepID=UPI00255441DD|nr:hypothetical protein [Marinobacter sp. SS13-12]MDK8465896.1 hypothetical protein [Marinobacter sp. SS13-12]
MATYRFVLSSPDRPQLYALGVKAKSLPTAREIASGIIESQERLVSTNVLTGNNWVIVEGEPVSDDDINAHPGQSELSIDVGGDAAPSYEGQILKPPVQLSTSYTSSEAVTSLGKSPEQREIKNSQSGLGFSLPTYETPLVVTVLGWFSGFVALGTLINLVSIDYRYLSTEMTSIILAAAVLTNLFFFSVTVAMSYLHRINFNTEASNLLLQQQLLKQTLRKPHDQPESK